jgi:SAM-dependent methyltransferase
MPQSPREIIEQHFRAGRPLDAFEAIYANAREHGGIVPWDDGQPAPHLVEWAQEHHIDGAGRRALVIGCGLGDDAEFLSRLGFDVTAFDLSASAIALCRERWPQSRVRYVVADLLNAPSEWQQAFDFVLESRTIQAIPWQYTEPAIRAISRFLAPGGDLLVLCLAREPHEPRTGIPWPLSRDELAQFEREGLRVVRWDSFLPHQPRFRVHYRRETAS